MAKVTALRVQKRNKQRVNVYLDGEYRLALYAVDAAALRLGQELTDEQIAAFQAGDERQKVYNHALQFLAHRPRSEQEVRRRLGEKEYPPEAIEAALARLRELALVDDLAFARYWVEQREQFRPRSPAMLRYELAQKGVAREVIETALESVDEMQSADQAAQRWLAQHASVAPEQIRDKLGSYLARRGFPYSTVRDVLERLQNDIENMEQEEVV